MKPNFALSLSFEGIGLLRRVEGGWHLLGEVALDVDDLADELAALRQIAIDLDGPDFRTKLILPNDQIKYLTLDTGRQSEAKRQAAAEAALEDSTPYTAQELSYALVKDGRKTHVAAVARETLEEAEAFVAEHALNPVCFVAVPDAGTGFTTEPFLGYTSASAKLLNGSTLDHDTAPVVIVGSGPLPTPEPEIEAPASDDVPLSMPIEAQEDTTPEPPAAPEPDLPEPETPPAAFSSIRAQRAAPAETSAAPALGAANAETSGVNAADLPRSANSVTEQTSTRFDPSALVAGIKQADNDAKGTQEPAKETANGRSSFFSRRAAPETTETAAGPSDDSPAPPKRAQKPEKADETNQTSSAEKSRMTVFGAREQETGGKPRFLGLILTALLLLGLAAVAAWASIFLEAGVSSLFRGEDDDTRHVISDIEPAPLPGDATAPATLAPSPEVVTIPEDHNERLPVETVLVLPESLNTQGVLVDSAEVEAAEEDLAHPTAPTEQEALARYAVTGIWERAPVQPVTPPTNSTDDLYIASIDGQIAGQDALALPSVANQTHDVSLPPQLSAPAAGTIFDLDERGLVVASVEGTLSPSGVMVYLGKPAIVPAAFPDRAAIAEQTFNQERARLAELRPRARPGNLRELSERASNGGLSLAELASKRPKLRPASVKQEEEQDLTPTKYAVTTSLKPRMRPANIAQLAARAKPAEPVTAVPTVASVTPKVPSKASVARQATIKNAINLNKVNLIGVYGTASSRRALVRLSSGRYKKVKVGDRIDGGKVSAIGETELRYQKSGRNVVLKLPKG